MAGSYWKPSDNTPNITIEGNPNGYYNPIVNDSPDADEANQYHDIGQSRFRHIDMTGVKYGVEAQLLRGTMSFSKNRLAELDPSYTGYTHVFVLKIPPFIRNVANGHYLGSDTKKQSISGNSQVNQKELAAMHMRNLRALFEMGCTSYSGTPDFTLNTDNVPTGWNDRNYPAPTYSEYNGTQFTLTCLECRGEPLRRGLEYYGNGVSDAGTKSTMLNGALEYKMVNGTNQWELMSPTLYNITWAFMIVQTDQTLINIQDVSIWQSCIVSGTVERSNLDWNNGEINIVQPKQVTFAGVYIPDTKNPLVYNRAHRLLAARLRYYRRYQDMDNNWLDTNGWDGDLTGNTGTTTMDAKGVETTTQGWKWTGNAGDPKIS